VVLDVRVSCLCFSLAMQVTTHCGLAFLTLDSLLASLLSCLALPEMLQPERSWAQFDVAIRKIMTKDKHTNTEGNTISLCFKIISLW
jgi:hypothetical protein